jgi:hypothetical protein
LGLSKPNDSTIVQYIQPAGVEVMGGHPSRRRSSGKPDVDAAAEFALIRFGFFLGAGPIADAVEGTSRKVADHPVA